MLGRILYKCCPLCESKDFNFLREGDCSGHSLYQPGIPPKIRWMRCDSCEHVFTEGYWTDELRDLIFSKAHDNQVAGANIEMMRPYSARMVTRVVDYFDAGWAPRSMIWLDVGFGNGSLLFTAEEYGFTTIGLDLRAENVEIMKRGGVEAYCLDIESAQDVLAPRRMNVISMADVLEHMPFPKQGLKAARRLLLPGGVLLVSSPVMYSSLWYYWDDQGINPYWDELEHFHIFSRERLYYLLMETGFQPLKYGISERYRGCMEVTARAS